MAEVNFEPVAIDNLFRGPGDRNAGAPRCHYHNVAIGPALQESDVAIMRENFWPQLQIGRCFEDRHFRCMHNDGIGLVHETASVTWKPATRAMLRNFPVTCDPSSKSSLVKEKIKQGGYSDSYSSILSSALHVNLRGSFPHQEPGCLSFQSPVPFLKRHHVWRCPHRLPVAADMRKMPAVGR